MAGNCRRNLRNLLKFSTTTFPGGEVGFRRSDGDSVPSPNGAKLGSKVEHLEGIPFSEESERNSW